MGVAVDRDAGTMDLWQQVRGAEWVLGVATGKAAGASEVKAMLPKSAQMGRPPTSAIKEREVAGGGGGGGGGGGEREEVVEEDDDDDYDDFRLLACCRFSVYF